VTSCLDNVVACGCCAHRRLVVVVPQRAHRRLVVVVPQRGRKEEQVWLQYCKISSFSPAVSQARREEDYAAYLLATGYYPQLLVKICTNENADHRLGPFEHLVGHAHIVTIKGSLMCRGTWISIKWGRPNRDPVASKGQS
jgi:hypothetical protein